MRDGRDELRLGTALQADAVGFAGVQHLLHHLVQLVNLDRVDGTVDIFIVRFLDRVLEG